MKKLFFEFCSGNRIEVDIPCGFYYKEGSINDGLVIEDEMLNQYVRIPTGYTSDGMYIRGFWVSRFEISIDAEGNPHSVAGKYPVININFFEAEKLAEQLNCQLLSKEQYNRICMWLVETGAATFEQVFLKGNYMGNYSNPFKLAKTGENQLWMKNRLDNFWGNCYIWTTEKSELYEHFRIARGGAGLYFGTDWNYSATCRLWYNPEEGSGYITLRAAIRDSMNNDDD